MNKGSFSVMKAFAQCTWIDGFTFPEVVACTLINIHGAVWLQHVLNLEQFMKEMSKISM